jgi:hypothetical protein
MKGEMSMQETTKGTGLRRSGARHWCTVLVCVSILSLLGGCAKFTSSRKMDAGPFGENVTIMMGDVSADVRKPFYIKKYVDGPSRDEYQAEWNNMKKTMRGVVLYSSQVVNISQSPMTERKKPNALAATLKEIISQVPDQRRKNIRPNGRS